MKAQLAKLFEASLKVTVPNEADVDPLIAACTGKFGDYQWYGVGSLIAKNILFTLEGVLML